MISTPTSTIAISSVYRVTIAVLTLDGVILADSTGITLDLRLVFED